jgi:chaperonin GroES
MGLANVEGQGLGAGGGYEEQAGHCDQAGTATNREPPVQSAQSPVMPLPHRHANLCIIGDRSLPTLGKRLKVEPLRFDSLDSQGPRPYLRASFGTLTNRVLAAPFPFDCNSKCRSPSGDEVIMAKTKFRPLYDRVVVKRVNAEEKSAGGIIIPDTAREKPQQGEITAVGPGGRDEAGKLIPIDLKVGDKVLFGKWSGTEVKLDGEELLIMKESDIMGVIA